MKSRRILITGISSTWGGHLAQALERDPEVEALVGIDLEDPRHELQRTEFVRVDTDPTLLRRIIAAAAIDTVIDTRLAHDLMVVPLERARETDVADTRKLLSACAPLDSPVRKVIFKSSAHVYGSDPRDPLFLTEDVAPRAAPRSALERILAEAEGAVAEFADARPRVAVSVLRFAEPLGTELRSSFMSLLNLPVVPSVLGFDPRCQFIHQDDVVAALAHAAAEDRPGTYNVAADGVLVLSEVVSLLGKRVLPLLPPWGTEFAAAQMRRLGVAVPLELLHVLRVGRGLDNRRFKAAGFAYRYTTRETVLKLRAHQRLRPLLGSGEGSYRYEREVEEFLRRSPSVQRRDGALPDGSGAGASAKPGASSGPAEPSGSGLATELERLEEGELLEAIASLDRESLRRLRRLEAARAGRSRILEELDRRLARVGG